MRIVRGIQRRQMGRKDATFAQHPTYTESKCRNTIPSEGLFCSPARSIVFSDPFSSLLQPVPTYNAKVESFPQQSLADLLGTGVPRVPRPIEKWVSDGSLPSGKTAWEL